MKIPRKPYLYEALFSVLGLIVVMAVSLVKYHTDPHVPMLIGSIFASIVAFRAGYSWEEIEKGMMEGIYQALQSVIILVIIGVLIGVWIVAGVVPSMIYYGLGLLTPKIFLLATLLICSIVSLATGTSWGTVGTIGIALMGIGQGLGMPPALVAGAIISGAYFGDKMSPLSDTTNLAPAVAGTDVFTHVKHMIFTTGVSYAIAAALYTVIGFRFSGGSIDVNEINAIKSALASQFTINPLLLIPPLTVILCVALKVPAIPGIALGVILGAVEAFIFQNADLGKIISAGYSGFVSETGNQMIDDLLSAGGMTSMMYSISLVIASMMFGGIMEKTGQLEVLLEALLRKVRSVGALICSTVLTCVASNMLLPEQYISIILPGRLYARAYREKGLHPKNLSRALEDAGTLTSPLVPWNTCGAFIKGVLGISAFAYGPWAFLNYINPIVSIIYGFTGFTIEKLREDE
ncbi:Na+/H+ antiporter NhaC [Thermosediminibacter oceani]|uniref:Na+/H+ antiporter NhaC n=1 Tax=Thermosediminibacter oceani (strain ATCC BAA-1034 / DSM 16646 / JW/IW-1228P) TaxID=555079 RepID=D9RY15_THEOJ|nr:Na+/H+ antiporter NhaC [Thermosediminibacter oceani]ADL08239.1 Na+/H+ antiporter NhaC [Thermosediminibacter oceani DSM 16646]